MNRPMFYILEGRMTPQEQWDKEAARLRRLGVPEAMMLNFEVHHHNMTREERKYRRLERIRHVAAAVAVIGAIRCAFLVEWSEPLGWLGFFAGFAVGEVLCAIVLRRSMW